MKTLLLLIALLSFIALTSHSAFASGPPVRRVAIVVGSGAPAPGRPALPSASDDARAMVDALTRAGGFAPDNLHLLLDPTPDEVLGAIDDVARAVGGGDAQVLFYYSGRTDGQSLYPHGEALSVAEVHARLSRIAARVRVAVLDTRRDDDAAEASTSTASSFPPAFASGLLGAANANGDREVTLEEACEYARPGLSPDGSILDGAQLGAATAPQLRYAALSLWSPPTGQKWLLHASVGLGTQTWPLANGGTNAANGPYTKSASFGAQLWYRITDRLSWNVPFPAFSYRFGDPGSVEVMPSMGLKLNSWSTSAGPSVGFSTDAAARIWTASNQRIILGAGVYLPAYKDSSSELAGIGIGNAVNPNVRGGYSWTIHHLVTLNAEVGYVQDYFRGTLEGAWVQPRAGVDIRLSPQTSLNLGALYSTEVHQNLGSYENFSVGTTVAF